MGGREYVFRPARKTVLPSARGVGGVTAETRRRTATGVGVYGSLVHPTELERSFPDAHGDAAPVALDGYRRSLDQRAAFREGQTIERGVAARPSTRAGGACA